jgi:hypothetical protein
MREVMTRFVEILLAQHLRLSLLGTSINTGKSYIFRFHFAIGLGRQLKRRPSN